MKRLRKEKDGLRTVFFLGKTFHRKAFEESAAGRVFLIQHDPARLPGRRSRARLGTNAAKDTEFPAEKLRRVEYRRKTGVEIRRNTAYFDKILCKSLQPLVEIIGKAANKY